VRPAVLPRAREEHRARPRSLHALRGRRCEDRMREPRPDRRRLESSYRHGMRVRINGEKGVLFRCEKRDQSGGVYWKVRLNGGAWVWPDNLVVDWPGDQIGTCGSCELPFYHRAGDGELLCDRCNAEQFGTATRAREDAHDAARDRSRYYHSLRRRR